jgi:hypothetical protein
MKTIYKIIIFCSCLIAFIVSGIYCGLIGEGSKPYAQEYLFKTSDSVLIKAVYDFKKNNPNFNVPAQFNLTDSYYNYKYNFYLYYANEDKLIHCFIITADNAKSSSIFLDAINYGRVLGNWRIVNRDYDRKENLKIKKEFEKTFLNKLKLQYHDEGNSMFIFWK